MSAKWNPSTADKTVHGMNYHSKSGVEKKFEQHFTKSLTFRCSSALLQTVQCSVFIHPTKQPPQPAATQPTCYFEHFKLKHYEKEQLSWGQPHVCHMAWVGGCSRHYSCTGRLSLTLPAGLEAQILPWCKPLGQARCRLCFPTMWKECSVDGLRVRATAGW